MFLELIATFVAGFAGAGVVLLVSKLTGGRLPKWAMPVAAGGAMIATTIANEYGWAPRARAALPPGFVIAEEVENQALYRPWTYAWPYVERFAAVDGGSVRTHARRPGQKLADVYLFGRWQPVHKLPVLADCAGLRRAALSDAVAFGENGEIDGLEWRTVTADDALLTTICGAG